MCAINPKHKKRLVLDVYTSLDISKEVFEKLVFEQSLQAEIDLNKSHILRWHLKETKQEAD